MAPSIFASSPNISGVKSQLVRLIPPEEILSNFVELPTTINAPVFLSAIKSTPSLNGSPGIN